MGTVPKRSGERLGHQNRAGQFDALQKLELEGFVDPPRIPLDKDGEPEWHPIAVQWYESLQTSGQRRFYEPSDWAFAYILAEDISRELKPQPVGYDENAGKVVWAKKPLSGGALASIVKGMSSLLCSEADRRRAQIELTRVRHQNEARTPEDELAARRDALLG